MFVRVCVCVCVYLCVCVCVMYVNGKQKLITSNHMGTWDLTTYSKILLDLKYCTSWKIQTIAISFGKHPCTSIKCKRR